jgi:hypothetical protein
LVLNSLVLTPMVRSSGSGVVGDPSPAGRTPTVEVLRVLASRHVVWTEADVVGRAHESAPLTHLA